METKIKPKRITDFKNDLVFKFMLSDLNDSRCYYLLKVIIEGITGIKCQELFVLNSEVNPEHLSDKDMVLDVRVKTDEGKLIDIEMQNSALTKEVHYRFQIYGARMMDHQVNRGDILYSENVHEVYTILFVNDIDRDNLLLIDTYMPRNQLNHVRKHNLLTHHNIYLPFIDAVVREKGLKNLSKIELAIYTLYHGITDDIIALNSEVVTMMKEKMSYRETARQFEISNHHRVQDWERIYLTEGPEGLAIERRGRSSKGRPPKQLPKQVEEDLLAEVQRLRAENDYLKNLQALVLEDERRQHKKRW